MTPLLEAAIAAIQPLSATERLQLLQFLIQGSVTSNSPTDLKALSFQFWQGISLQQLRTTQTSTIADNLKDLTADFWPVEDSIEDFLAFLRKQRQEAI
jgi:hypothetical protein